MTAGLPGRGWSAERAVAAGAGLALAGALVAGCGSASSASHATPVSTGSRGALAGRVLDVMDQRGIPVQDDHIGCLANLGGRSDTCYGLIESEPLQQVEGVFSTSTGPASWAHSGCPGTLVVTMGPQSGGVGAGKVVTVKRLREDPCR